MTSQRRTHRPASDDLLHVVLPQRAQAVGSSDGVSTDCRNVSNNGIVGGRGSANASRRQQFFRARMTAFRGFSGWVFEKAAGRFVLCQERLDAAAQPGIGPARLIEPRGPLSGHLLVQRRQKDRLLIHRPNSAEKRPCSKEKCVNQLRNPPQFFMQFS